MTKMAQKPPQTRGIAHVHFPVLNCGTSQDVVAGVGSRDFACPLQGKVAAPAVDQDLTVINVNTAWSQLIIPYRTAMPRVRTC
jgi:hypothetical protein